MTPADELAERPYERLRRILDRAGLSNREVAERLEVAAETVSRWRSGQQEARGRDLRALIALMSERGIAVTEEWIRSGENTPVAEDRRTQLARAMQEGAKSPRGAQLEPKDVPAADPRKKPAAQPGKGKRAG